MAGTVTRPGWEVDDPNKSSTLLKATLPAPRATNTGGATGSVDRVVVKTNIANGNYDVYKPGLFGDQLIYSYNASTNTIANKNTALFNEKFDPTKPAGNKNFTALNNSIRQATLDNAQANAGTDPIGIQNYNTIKSRSGYQSLANKAPAEPGPPPGNPPNSGTQPAAAPSPRSLTADQVRSGIGGDKNGTRRKFPGGPGGGEPLTYPLSLRNSKQDKIQFNMIEYVPSTIGQGQLGFNTAERANVGGAISAGNEEKVIGRVFLPIPNGISDTTGAGWGEDRMDAAKIATAGAALGFIEQGGGGLVKSIEDTLNSVSAYSDDVKKAIATQVAGSASGTGAGLLTRTTGAVLNPNLELLFQGPTLRPFDFVFKLSARSQRESDEIIKIIRFFKQGMAPIRSESNLFLKSPHTFKIRYLHNDEDHPFLNKFKICALKSLTVNYTPDGNYATFRDGKMVSYELNMSFQELDPVFNDDYPEDNDKSIGF